MTAARFFTLALAAIAISHAPSQAQDFYQGKTLSLVVGYSAGGGYDINARLVSRHFGHHIPGHPNVVVVNMPGAGSLRSVEHLERHAPRDGTVINMFDYTQITNSLLTPDKVPIDFHKFKWIGSLAQDLAVCYVWHTVNARTIADLQRLPKIHMGRTNPGTSSDTQQRILRKLFNVNVLSVAGYAGSAEAFIAVERGELDGGCMTWASLPPAWISGSKITPILRITSATAPDLPQIVPSAFDLLDDERDRKTLRALSAAGEIGKPLVLHLSVPNDRVQTLRNAFAAMTKDPVFLADADKLRQNISPKIGEDALKIIEEIYASSTDVVEAARAIAID